VPSILPRRGARSADNIIHDVQSIVTQWIQLRKIAHRNTGTTRGKYSTPINLHSHDFPVNFSRFRCLESLLIAVSGRVVPRRLSMNSLAFFNPLADLAVKVILYSSRIGYYRHQSKVVSKKEKKANIQAMNCRVFAHATLTFLLFRAT